MITPIVRRGLAQLINGQKDLMVCGEADSVAEAMNVLGRQRPDLAIIDLSLGSGDGTELCRDIQIRYPGLPVLILSMHDETLYAERCLRAGARGYIMKQEDAEKLLQAARKVLDGGIAVSEKMAARMLNSLSIQRSGDSLTPTDRLSDRELQIFRLIGQGVGVRQIAQDLGLKPQDHRSPPRAYQDQAPALQLQRNWFATRFTRRWKKPDRYSLAFWVRSPPSADIIGR